MKILYKMLQGSSSWKSKHAHDIDYVFIVDSLENGKEVMFKKDIINDIDIFYCTLDYAKSLMQGDFSKTQNKDYKTLCNLYLEMNNLDFPIKDANWLKVEEKYKTTFKDKILNDLSNDDKYLYTHYILFKMWEYKTSEFKDEYTKVVDDFKARKNIKEMKEYIKTELGAIHNE